MHLQGKIYVVRAMNKVYSQKFQISICTNIKTHNPGLFNCHDKQICALS